MKSFFKVVHCYWHCLVLGSRDAYAQDICCLLESLAYFISRLQFQTLSRCQAPYSNLLRAES